MPDQRHRTRAEERAEDIDIRPTKLLEDIESLRGELAEAKAQGDEYLTALQRARAESVASDPWFEGLAAIDRKLRQLLESEGVSPIDAGPGTPFDPREHDAIATVPGSGRAEGEIVEQVRRGYRLRDRVLRPALVAVARATEPAPTNDRPN